MRGSIAVKGWPGISVVTGRLDLCQLYARSISSRNPCILQSRKYSTLHTAQSSPSGILCRVEYNSKHIGTYLDLSSRFPRRRFLPYSLRYISSATEPADLSSDVESLSSIHQASQVAKDGVPTDDGRRRRFGRDDSKLSEQDTGIYELENFDKFMETVSPAEADALRQILKMHSPKYAFQLELKLARMSEDDKNNLREFVIETLKAPEPTPNLRLYLQKHLDNLREVEEGYVGEDHEMPRYKETFKLRKDLALRIQGHGKKKFWTYEMYRNRYNKPVTVKVVTTFEAFDRTLKSFEDEDVVGFDMEWVKQVPSRGRDIKRTVSVIQIAKEDLILIFHVAAVSGPVTQADFRRSKFAELIHNPHILKAGAAIHEDGKRIVMELGLKPEGFVDLTILTRAVSNRPSGGQFSPIGLSRLTEKYLGFPLAKSIKHNAWTQRLTPERTAYAANDAYAGYKLYKVMDGIRRQKAGPHFLPLPYLPQEFIALANKQLKKRFGKGLSQLADSDRIINDESSIADAVEGDISVRAGVDTSKVTAAIARKVRTAANVSKRANQEVSLTAKLGENLDSSGPGPEEEKRLSAERGIKQMEYARERSAKRARRARQLYTSGEEVLQEKRKQREKKKHKVAKMILKEARQASEKS